MLDPDKGIPLWFVALVSGALGCLALDRLWDLLVLLNFI